VALHETAVVVRPHPRSIERLAFPVGTAAVGLLAGAACLPGARRFALWQDEVASARVVAEPHPLAMLHHVARTESTPPLWYALAWLVHRCGIAVEDVRLLSVAAAVLLAVGTAVAARRLVPAQGALLAGAAVALGYQFDFHGRELRGYELAALLTLALAVAAVRGRGLQLAAVVAAGTLTHYFFLFSVAAVLIWRPARWRAVAAGLVPLALWSPVLVRQYDRHRFAFIGPFRLHTVLTTYWATFARAQPHAPVLHDAAPLALLAGVAAGSFVLARGSDEGRLWALLALAPVAAAATLWLAGARVYDVRNLLGTGPFAAVAVAALVARLPRRASIAVACALAVLLGTGYVRANRAHPVAYDRIAAALVAEGWQPRDPIVVEGNLYALWGPLEWYLPGRPTLVAGRPSRARPVFVVGARWTPLARRADTVRWIRRTIVGRVDAPAPVRGALLVEARG
jgi:hypothetical protein